MIKKSIYQLSIRSKKNLKNKHDFLDAVKQHCEMLPEYIPMKAGWADPLKLKFNSNDLSNLVLENGDIDNTWWKRTGKNRAEGHWMWSAIRNGSNEDTHSSISFDFYDTKLQDKLINYLKQACIKNAADFGFIDSIAEQYEDFAKACKYTPFGGNKIKITTHVLRNWLPDMPWAVVFGPAYIEMFGKDHLLSTPAFIIEEISKKLIYIQLTPKMNDIHYEYELVMEARKKAKQHLGDQFFFNEELAYDFDVEPDKIGKVFVTPEFIFDVE